MNCFRRQSGSDRSIRKEMNRVSRQTVQMFAQYRIDIDKEGFNKNRLLHFGEI